MSYIRKMGGGTAVTVLLQVDETHLEEPIKGQRRNRDQEQQ